MDDKTRKDRLKAKIKDAMLRGVFAMSLLRVIRDSKDGSITFEVNKNSIAKFADEFVKINIETNKSEVKQVCIQIILERIGLDLIK